MTWYRYPEVGPRRRCMWGVWRCDNNADWVNTSVRRGKGFGQAYALCEQHYRRRRRAEQVAL